MRVFVILCCLAQLVEFGHSTAASAPKNTPLGPAVSAKTKEAKPSAWLPYKYCPAGQFIISGTIKKAQDSTIEMKCSDKDKRKGDPKGTCFGFAVGYQATWTEVGGLVALEIECYDNIWKPWLDLRKSHQRKNKILQPRFRCKAGSALCGYRIQGKVSENIEFTCCETPSTSKNTERRSQGSEGSKGMPEIGPISTKKSNWSEPYYCPGKQLAHGLVISQLTPNWHSVYLKCGRRAEYVDNTCPWLMTGFSVSETPAFITKVSIECESGPAPDVFKRGGKFEGETLSDQFKCQPEHAVCGVQVQGNVESLKFFCCKVPTDLHPCEAEAWFEQVDNKPTLGLTKQDEIYGAVQFRHASSSIYMSRVTKAMEAALAPFKVNKPLGSAEITPRTLSKELSNKKAEDMGMFQLVVRCGTNELRLDDFAEKKRKRCAETEKGVYNCRCIQLKKRQCDPQIFWTPVVIANGAQVQVNDDEVRMTYTSQNRSSGVTLLLGLLQHPVKFDDKKMGKFTTWSHIKESSGILEFIEDKLCFHDLPSIRHFDFTKRAIQLKLDSAPGVTLVQYQLAATCGEFQIRFDVYRKAKVDPAKFSGIFCELPYDEAVNTTTIIKHCNIKSVAPKV